MRRAMAFIIFISFCAALAGCGETISGVGKDAGRIGKGVKTIFIKDSAE